MPKSSLTLRTAAVLDFLESGESNFMSVDLITRAEAQLKAKEEEKDQDNDQGKEAPVIQPVQKYGWLMDSDEEWLVADGIISSDDERH